MSGPLRRIGTWASLAVITGLSLTGCGGPPATEPELLIARYFEAVGDGRFDDVLPLYSPRFFEKTSRDAWRQSLVDVRGSLGELQSYKVQRPFPEPEEGPGGSYRAKLVYIVQYSRFKAEETVTVFKEPDDGPISILEHNIRYLEGS